MSEVPRLMEEYLPVGTISRESIREKSAGRDFHPSTLHWWWARRPLAAARAAVLGALVPRQSFPGSSGDIDGFFETLSHWEGNEVGLNPAALDRARQMLKEAWPDRPPQIIDSFGGAGTIPLEALRLGASAAGVELNPVAYLVGLGTVVWPQTYGTSLADDVERWARWVGERTKQAVAELYPEIRTGGKPAAQQLALDSHAQPEQLALHVTPQAYLWTRTVRCPNPLREAHEVPLLRSKHVVRKPGHVIGLRVLSNTQLNTFGFQLVDEAQDPGSVRRTRSSASACPLCGATITAKYLKEQGSLGRIGHQLVAVVYGRGGNQGKYYVSSTEAPDALPDPKLVASVLKSLADLGFTPPAEPIEPMGNAGLASGETYLYGISTFADVFTKRQVATLLTLCKYVREARQLMTNEGMQPSRADAIAAYLGLIVNRVLDRSTSLCRWNLTRETVESPFIRDRLAMLWDFVEVHPFGGISGDYFNAATSVTRVIRHCARIGQPADWRRGSATSLPFEDSSFDAAIIDPPYYDNISYANSSDFYYVWLKRSIGHLFPEHFAGPVAPKRNEVIAAAYRHGKDKLAARQHYEDLMTASFVELRRVLRPAASLVVVYAHQTTAGWATLIQSLRRAGFTVVEAWPLDTERAERRGGQENASLASSIFLVARRRDADDIGQWESVASEFDRVVEERVDALSSQGITGADLVIASIGAGLNPYTRFAEVELPNGERMTPDAYLDEVQTTVVKTVLSKLMGVSKPGVEGVDPVTQLYVLGRFEYGDTELPFDELNTLAHGVMAGAKGRGIELVGPRGLGHGPSALIEQDGDTVRLRDYHERGESDALGLSRDGRPAPLIDVLHRLLWLAENEPLQVRDYLLIAQPDATHLKLVAQALSGSGLSEKGVGTSAAEQAAVRSIQASWKRLVEDSLFAVQR